jgi:hypothetical protein
LSNSSATLTVPTSVTRRSASLRGDTCRQPCIRLALNAWGPR